MLTVLRCLSTFHQHSWMNIWSHSLCFLTRAGRTCCIWTSSRYVHVKIEEEKKQWSVLNCDVFERPLKTL